MIKFVTEFSKEAPSAIVEVKYDEVRRTIRMTAETGYDQTVVRVSDEGKLILPKIYCAELAQALGISVGDHIKLEE
tara:strand:+ start:2650 stop:2877 length:228 start_codon:yes stop_codon:yes gene_type:complete